MLRRIAILAAGCLWLGCQGQADSAETTDGGSALADPALNAPANDASSEVVFLSLAEANVPAVTVALENDYVTAFRVQLPPGGALPRHRGGRRVVVALGDYELKGLEAETSDSWTRGEIHMHEAQVHATKNTGSEETDFLIIERSAAPLPSCDEATLSARLAESAPDIATLEGESAFARVERVQLAPGSMTPPHRGANRTIVALNDFTLEFNADIQPSFSRNMSTGDILWYEQCQNTMRNLGDTMADYAVISFTE